jgi:hypothetical protein
MTNNEEFQKIFQKKLGSLNGFSWVLDNIIGGMRQPQKEEDLLPIVEKYNIGLVVSLTEEPLPFQLDVLRSKITNILLPITGLKVYKLA